MFVVNLLFGLLCAVSIVILHALWRVEHPNGTAYQFVFDLQTGLGALLGLYGLMLVEWARVANERRADLRRRACEAETVAALLWWELSVLLPELDRLDTNTKGFESTLQAAEKIELDPMSRRLLQLRPSQVTRAEIARLADLDPQATTKTAVFLEEYEETRRTLLDLLGPADAPARPPVTSAVVDTIRHALNIARTRGAEAYDAVAPLVPKSRRIGRGRTPAEEAYERQQKARKGIDSRLWGAPP